MNRRHTTAILIGMATLILFCSSANAATLEEIEKDLDAKCKKLKSYSGISEMKTDADMGNGNRSKSTMNMTIEWMRDGDKQLFRGEGKSVTNMSIGGKEMTNKSTILSIGDGKYMYTLTETNGAKTAMKMNWDESMGGPNGLKHIKKDHDCKALPDKKVGEHDCYVIEATPKNKAQNPAVSKFIHCFDKESGLPIQMTMFDAKGKKSSEMTMKEYKLNPKLSKERFVFKCPEGVQVMDMTAMQGMPGGTAAPEKGKDKEEKKE